MNIRKANLNDLDKIMIIIDMAKAFLKSQGINQWQDGYPNSEIISQDINRECYYVVCNGENIAGVFFFSYDDEEYYKTIDQKWLSDEKYGVIHRIAVSDHFRNMGICKLILDYCKKTALLDLVHSIKIDTHFDNKPMRNFLTKNNFTECGTVNLPNNEGERIAYQILF